jgi:hypothetical protein
MIFVLLLYYVIAVALVAGVIAMIVRVILPGFPFWIGFLIAFAGTFLTLMVTGFILTFYAVHK